MNASEKIIKAKVQLILVQPFFASLAQRMQFLPDTTQSTATTNGKYIKYNPAYIEQLTLEELKGMIAHEVMHTAMLHHTRRGHRDKVKWNHACDYAINPLLIDAGFQLPKGYLTNAIYRNMSAEQVYNLLPVPEEQMDASGNNNGGTGDVEDTLLTGTTMQETESEVKQALVQSAMIAKRQGKLPAFVQRLIEDLLRPRIAWQEVLSRFLSETNRNDYTWKKPSPRHIHCDLYLPALEALETGKVILLVDTSGSINRTLLNQFAAEAQDIATTFNLSLQIIYVDTIVQGVQEIEPDTPIQLNPYGGGGTDFRPGFTYIEENDLQPKVAVYLTDGECRRFPSEPEYPVLWAQFGKATFIPPFGETIQIT
ncbi:vWA domain-containing protein [Chitinophaga cymbidii]|uniref:Hydrolase n=1 Tax=Chitinophaga cymbidii TaxID=1096750 RepID=A0A512RFQ9_9BACT|nr:VWA-like domain-containing protein [Chitinophaga cymbidii]GEP94488.1 hydrolase [Chitinophaga cymbidii]